MSMMYEQMTYFINESEYHESYRLIYQVLKHGKVFSLLVIMTDENEISETTFIYDVTRDESVACELVEILSRNTVTPCTVECILADLFSELDFHLT